MEYILLDEKEKIFEIIDNFLIGDANEDGNDRSLGQLMGDRNKLVDELFNLMNSTARMAWMDGYKKSKINIIAKINSDAFKNFSEI